MASELGSMLVTEQVNAMRALGTDPIKKLVVPRVVATTIMMPILTIAADAVGILGGLAVSTLMLRISSNQYLGSAFDGLENIDIFGGLLKPLVFGTIIALVGCHCGLRTYGGTQGVGRSTTQAVVNASVLILLFDFLLSRHHPELHMNGAILELRNVVKVIRGSLRSSMVFPLVSGGVKRRSSLAPAVPANPPSSSWSWVSRNQMRDRSSLMARTPPDSKSETWSVSVSEWAWFSRNPLFSIR